MLKRWIIATSVLLYLLICGLIVRVVLRSRIATPTLAAGNLTLDVDPHWTAHQSTTLTSLTRKGFRLNLFVDNINLLALPTCASETNIQSRLDDLQHIFEKTQKIIPGARVQRVELSTQSGPATCINSYSNLDPSSPINVNCILHKDGSTFQGAVEPRHLEEAFSMIRSTRDAISCPASQDDSTASTPSK